MFNLNKLIRKNIRLLKPYSSARDEFSGNARIYLDANENSEGTSYAMHLPAATGLNYYRYPDPHQAELKKAISKIKPVPEENILLGNGSDECIDLLFRSFCEPSLDNVIIIDPTYGMYEVAAEINGVEVRKAPLQNNFQLDLGAIEKLVDANTKIIWLCSPNNPTGITLDRTSIFYLLAKFGGLVVVDEAYIDFSSQPSFLPFLKEYPNLVILQTFSKAWGLAALRIGMAFASSEIMEVLKKVKPPYNISTISQDYVLKAISAEAVINESVAKIVSNRKKLAAALEKLSFVKYVFPSDANFLLLRVSDAKAIYQYLLSQGIVVRDRSNALHCDNCLRITVGTNRENKLLIETLNNYSVVTA